MAAMLGGTMRAPLTGALFAVELTGNLHALPALLAATVTAYGVTVLLLKRSILTEKIARRGQHITREYGVDPYELSRVREVMVRQVEVLQADLAIPEAVAVLTAGRHRVYPVVDGVGRPVGLVSRADALRWGVEGGHDRERVGEQVSGALPDALHPDDVVVHAVDLMLASGQGRLPVTDPETGKLVGLVTRKDILQVRAGVRREFSGRMQAYFVRPRPLAGRVEVSSPG